MNSVGKGTKKKNPTWVIVAGGVNRLGGTDKANLALVEYLLELNHSVHVVTHRIDENLIQHSGISVELVPVPAGSWFLGETLLSLRGCQVAEQVTLEDPEARVVVNGGNCPWADINWAHRVHHAWAPETVDAPWIHRVKHQMAVRSAKRRELTCLRKARMIVANSELTRKHLIEHIGVDPRVVRAIPLGSESGWMPPDTAERERARQRLDLSAERPLVLFIGAIGYDNNKGLDTLFRAWSKLCFVAEWDADLIIVGDGRALPRWRSFAAQSDFGGRVRLIGFSDQIPDLLAAADLLVSPVRYESYGLNVQEALCRGVPAIVSAGAGVAERYPSQLRDLLLPDAEDFVDLVNRMFMWRSHIEFWRQHVTEFSKELRAYSWRDMAECIYRFATTDAGHMSVTPKIMVNAGGAK
jgi:glycosyltransferase involved in cell wall biosynthesis